MRRIHQAHREILGILADVVRTERHKLLTVVRAGIDMDGKPQPLTPLLDLSIYCWDCEYRGHGCQGHDESNCKMESRFVQ